MIQEDIGLVTGDLKGASWRGKVGANQQYDSTVEEASKKSDPPYHQAALLFGAMAASRINGPTCAGSSNSRIQKRIGTFMKNWVDTKKMKQVIERRGFI